MTNRRVTAHQPVGRLLRRCLILVTLAICLTPVSPPVDASGLRSRKAPRLEPTEPQVEGWANNFHSGLDGKVYALATGPEGSVYVGGQFTSAGGVAVNHIARWDGTTWHPLGSGMNSTVLALAIGSDGSIYAGGSFSTAGGVAASGVARWDGTAWQPLGSGVDRGVTALAVGTDGSLYVGGEFTAAGGATANYIARWDGAAWHPLDSGMGNFVNALAAGEDGAIYAGGGFDSAGGVPARRIARWNGVAWQALGAGINYEVLTLALGPDGSLYAGGFFTSAGGAPAKNIARWDEAGWHPLASGLNSDVEALAFGQDGSLYAGGWFDAAGGEAASRVALWDPMTSAWRALGRSMAGGSQPCVLALTIALDGSLYAGGDFFTAGDVGGRIARWDGAAWNAVGVGDGINGPTPIVSVLARGPDGSVYAGGDFTAAGGIAASHIARWNGATLSWHALGSGIQPCQYCRVNALAVGPDGSLYVGGRFTVAGGVAANNIARWDSAISSWRPLSSGTNSSVNALAVGPDGTLYAGGFFSSAGGVPAYGVARWNETAATWEPLGSGIGGYVNALAAAPDGSLYAGGEFYSAGGLEVNNIARWDGVEWQRIGSGIEGDATTWVLALAIGTDGSLYAGGRFFYAGGVPAGNIARWDGAVWHALGGTNGTVQDLTLDPSGSLVLGGSFSYAGAGILVNRIARWNPKTATYETFGSGMDNSVGALLAAPDGSIYAGGIFTTAGGLPSHRIARWNTAPPTAVTLISLDTAASGDALAPGWLAAALAAIALAIGAAFARREYVKRPLVSNCRTHRASGGLLSVCLAMVAVAICLAPLSMRATLNPCTGNTPDRVHRHRKTVTGQMVFTSPG